MKKLLTLILLLKIFSIFSNPENTVNELFDLMQQGANHDYIGEPVSQLEHALQAAQQAFDAHSDDETILAALFHDIGQLCADKNAEQMDGGFGVVKHELVGANFLKSKGFSNKVFELVKSHVDAKRYLTYKKGDEYYNQLSEASKETLKRQGGMMTPSEAQEFERDQYFKEKITMRLWDEKAKIKGAKTHDLSFYKEICLKHLKK